MKKLIALLLALVMVLALTACGEPKTEAPAADTAESGEVELMIGGVGPLTGDYAIYGMAVRNGAQIAVDEINAAGGINGMKVVLGFEDSVGDPDSAVNAYGKLMDDGMDVSLGGVLSGETASIVAAAREDGILVLTPSGSADAAITGNDAAFRVCFQDSAQGTASANYMADNDLPKEVAVLYQSDIDYSVGLYNSFVAQAAERGITIVETQTFTNDTKTDFSTQINAIKDSGVELVFIPIYYSEAATFLTQAQEKLAEGTVFFGCDGLDGILGAVADPAQAENVMMLTPFVADDPDEAVQAFVSTYQSLYNEVPNQFAADGYDAVYAIKAAIEKAGIKAGDADFNEKIVAAMLEISVPGLTGEMTWNANGEPEKPAKAMIIHDGVATLFGA